MARSDIIAGLDIGTTKTAVVIAAGGHHDGALDVVGFGVAPSLGLRKGVVTDLEETVKSIEAAIEAAERMAGASIQSAFVGVTGEHVKSQNTHGIVAVAEDNEVSPLDVKRVVDASTIINVPPDRQIIHTLPREYAVDGQNGITDPVGMAGGRLEVDTHVVTAGTSFVTNVLKCVHRAGVEPAGIVFEPLASGAAVLLPEERNAGVVLLDIGGGTTDMAVYWGGGVYHTWTVPVGGNIVTNDIALGLKTSFQEAEAIKHAYGTADLSRELDQETFEVKALSGRTSRGASKHFLRQIIVARMTEIFKLVRTNVAENCPPEVMLAELVLTGGGSQLAGLDRLASDYFDLPARIGHPMHVGGLTETIKNPAYATAVGLVLFSSQGDGGVKQMRTNGRSAWTRVAAWWEQVFG